MAMKIKIPYLPELIVYNLNKMGYKAYDDFEGDCYIYSEDEYPEDMCINCWKRALKCLGN
jgi:hypothetical protein